MNFSQLSAAAMVSAVMAVFPPAGCAAEPTPASDTYISSLVLESLSVHPKLEAARARTLAAWQALDAIPLWEDPMAGFGIMAADDAMRRDDGDIRATVDQSLPRPGLYRAEKHRAAAAAAVQHEDERVTANDLGLAMAKMTVSLALTDELIRLQTAETDWVRTLTASARERSKNPDASAVEPLRLESELSVMEQNLESARRDRVQLTRILNLMLLRKSDAAWPELALPPQAAEPLRASALRAGMERRNPRLLALRRSIEAATAETEVSRARRKPVISVGVDSSVWHGGDFRSAMFSLKLTLPWFNKKSYQADTARRETMELAARKDLEAELLDFSTQLTELLTTAENNSRLAAAYLTEVIPRTEKSLEAIQNAWISSKASLLEVLDAHRILINARISQKRAAAARITAVQQLSALTGAFSTPASPRP